MAQASTTSTTTATGAIVTAGGVGVEENLNVGGDVANMGDLTVNNAIIKVSSMADIDREFRDAARKGDVLELLRLRVRRGAMDLDGALGQAAHRGKLEAMYLLHSWGATLAETFDHYPCEVFPDKRARVLLEQWAQSLVKSASKN